MFSFIRFLLWTQWLLLKDATLGLWRGSFNCRGVEQEIVHALNIQIHNITPRDLRSISPQTKIIFANHRSFTDFFLDGYLAGGAANLSRYMVALALPMVGIYGMLTGRGLFFNRGGAKRPALTQKILTHLQKHQKPLIIYPEGTRYLGPTPIALRHGTLKITFENNLPCQILIASGKEGVLNEKSHSIGTGKSCYYTVSSVIVPQHFATYEDFFEHISKIWSECWIEAYTKKTGLQGYL